MALLINNCMKNVKQFSRCHKVCSTNSVLRNTTRINCNVILNKRQNNLQSFEELRRSLHSSSIAFKSVAFKLSDIGEGIREVVIKEWFVKVGDKVQQFDNICEVQSDKASVTITSRYDGVVTRLYHKVDQTALVGQPLVDIEVEGAEEKEPSSTKEEGSITTHVPASQLVDNSNKSKVLTTPAVRRIASQFQVNLSSVPATGRNGRLLKEDLLAYLNITSDKSNEVPEIRSEGVAEVHSTPEVILEDKVVPVTGFTKAMVKTMTEAMKIPHFGFCDEYDVTKLVDMREKIKQIALKRGVKLTYMPIIVKAASLSLLNHPILNSSLDSSCENIIYKASHNIGVAMDTPNGLVVPVIKSVLRNTTRINCNVILNKRQNNLQSFEELRRSLHSSSIAFKSVAFKLSDIGEGIREVVIKEWFVKVGDKVQQFDNICEVQSDKASVTITSRYDGVVTRLYHKVDQTALVGQPLVDIEVEGAEEKEPSSTKEEGSITTHVPASQLVDNSNKSKVLTTPAVRRIASQFQVNLSSVPATGRNGRLLKEDLLAYLNITSDKSNEVPEIRSEGVAEVHSTPEVILEDKVVPVTGFTKAMVKTMTEAMKIPHFGFCDEYDVTKLVDMREKIKQIALKRGVKLTYMPIIVKAASLSLLNHPILNSSLDSSCENIIYKASHNIGVAMDTPNGLVVPVIKNVQNKSVLEIAKELNLIQEKGAKGQLGLSDLSGGTFTISNIGIVGGTYTKPVIVPPQVSIGALGRIRKLPRYDEDGNVKPAHILTVSWSADHRVIDGVTIARFSNDLKNYLEKPYLLLLDL